MARMSGLDRSLAPWQALLREQRYRRHFLREDGRQTAIVMAVVGVAYAASAYNDLPLLRGGLLGVSLASRGLLAVVAGVVVVLLRRAAWPRQQDRAFQMGLFAVAIFTSAVHLGKVPSGQILGPLIAGGAVLCLLYFAQRGPIVPRAIVGSVIAIVGVVLVLPGNPAVAIPPAARVTSMLALVALNVAGIFSARSFEEQRRKRFDAERRERHARQELAVNLRELAVQRDRAEAMSRARGAFLAVMSHELRTPMNAVIGLSDVLLDAPLAAEHRAHVRVISDSARALLGMLNDILDFAKIDAQKLTLSPAPFDLRALAASVVDMLRPAAAARSVALSLELASDVPERLLGDDVRLRQVLVNLVSNAVKFTERGAVTLRISARAVAGSGSDHEITFCVEDTGIGMAPDVIGRLFRPFEQADGGITRRYGGSGLGLAISKQIVAAMGGDIHVESEPGRGSIFSFTLRLPATATPAPAVGPPRREERPPLAILVVDDHPINREVASFRLGRLGYPVDLASDGPEAIEAVSRKEYDVVLMDLQMPGMSGIEATAHIRERHAGTRAPHVVAMTANLYEEDREACRRAGMRDFVGKPIDLAQLDAVLSRVAEERGAAAPKALPAAALAGETLAKLREIESLGEPGFLAGLGRRFVADARRRVPRMAEAFGRRDARDIEREAHTLASSSATLGAIEMSELCARIERAAREGRVEEIGGAIDALAVKLAEVEGALAREIEGEPRNAALEAP